MFAAKVNLDLLKQDSKRKIKTCVESLNRLGYTRVRYNPTRFTNSSALLIDQ